MDRIEYINNDLPGSSNTQVQYNLNGRLSGSANLTWNNTTGELVAPIHVANNGIMVHSANVTGNYTIATGYNGLSVGPITVASGAAVTVSANQRWIIL
jgi:hypothetical protein